MRPVIDRGAKTFDGVTVQHVGGRKCAMNELFANSVIVDAQAGLVRRRLKSGAGQGGYGVSSGHKSSQD